MVGLASFFAVIAAWTSGLPEPVFNILKVEGLPFPQGVEQAYGLSENALKVFLALFVGLGMTCLEQFEKILRYVIIIGIIIFMYHMPWGP